MHNEIYSKIAENFFEYVKSLDIEEIDAHFVSSGLNSIQNIDSVRELIMLLDFFYFINGGFPKTAAHTFIPRADLSLEVNGEEINIKKLYEKFRGTNSHGIVAAQFMGALNIFFSVEIL